MSEPRESDFGQSSSDSWDYDEWKDEGFEAIERKCAAESAEKRDDLIVLLQSMTDPNLKLALLGLASKSLRFNRDDQSLITEQDEVAAVWFAQKDQARQAEIEEYEKEKKLILKLQNMIHVLMATHPNIRHERMKDDYDIRDVIVGEFRGSFQGEEIDYRLVALVPKSNDEETNTSWVEIPKTPEVFDPKYTDFGYEVTRDRTRYSMWRKEISGPVAVVGSVVKLWNEFIDSGLVLDNPNAPPINYFGNIPLISSHRRIRDELPVIFDQRLRSYGGSEAGRDTLIDPDSDQLKRLLDLVNTSEAVGLTL